jgi:choline dehydrogenase
MIFEADFIVVGAGTAGCVMAHRLAQAGKTCLVVEAGGSDAHPHVRIPAAFGKLFKSRRDWAYATVPQPHLDGRRIFWPRGKMVGGCSSMNAQIHQWCDGADFDAWEAAGATGWGAQAMRASLRRTEAWSGIARAGRGHDGGLAVAPLRDPHPLSLAFVEAARRVLGPCDEDYNLCGGTGAWLSQVAQRRGLRANAADGFLRPALAQAQAQLITGAHVLSLLIANGRAIGANVIHDGREQTLMARAGVVLAAGAVNTPQLLLLSGIGDPAQLARHGIPLAAAAPAVGENLQDHLMAVMHFATRRQDTLKNAESLASFASLLARRRGQLTSNVAEAISFLSTRAGALPDIEILFAPVIYAGEGLVPPAYHGFSLAVVLLTPKSRGRVTLSSRQPMAPPDIDPAYLSDPGDDDMRRLIEGVRMARRIAAQEPLANEVAAERLPASSSVSDDDVAAFIRARAHTIYHPVGTCRMGSDASAVVGPDLRVRGVDRLWVADASVMPTVPRGHPNAVVAAIADRGAGLVLASTQYAQLGDA